MRSKLTIPYAVGHAKQITIPWEQDLLGNAYGVEARDGNALSRYGIVPLEEYQTDMAMLQGVWKVADGVLEWTTEGNLLLRASQTYDAICNQSFNYVQVLNCPDCLLLLTDCGVWMLQNGCETAQKLDVPPFVKGLMHKGRCFALTGKDNRVYFSSLENPTCFEDDQGGGWLAFDERGGKCVALAVVANKLCVFRQHSVEMVVATADRRDMSVSSLSFACGRLYGNTVASNGNEAVFLTDWGLWSFDGKVFSRLAKHLDCSFAAVNDYATATWCDHGYLLHCKLAFDGAKVGCEKASFVNNALVVVSNGVVVLRGLDCTHLVTASDNQALFTANGIVYTITQQQQDQPRGCSLQTTFNSHKGKTVQFVTVATTYPVTMVVHYNNTSKTFCLQASNQPQSVFVNATGKRFKFEFSANGKLCLSPVTVDYLVYKGGVKP